MAPKNQSTLDDDFWDRMTALTGVSGGAGQDDLATSGSATPTEAPVPTGPVPQNAAESLQAMLGLGKFGPYSGRVPNGSVPAVSPGDIGPGGTQASATPAPVAAQPPNLTSAPPASQIEAGAANQVAGQLPLSATSQTPISARPNVTPSVTSLPVLAGVEQSSVAGLQPSKPIQTAQLAAIEAEKTANNNIAQAEANKQKAISQKLQDQSEQLKLDQTLFENQQEANKIREQQEFNKVQALVQERKKIKAGPQHFWKTRALGEQGSQALAIIGMALGAFGAAINGGPNHAAELINKAIDRDLGAQQAELDRKKEDIDLANNGLAYFRSKGLNERQAYLAERQVKLDAFRDQINATAAKFGSQAALSQAEKLNAHLEQDKQNLLQGQHMAAQGKNVEVRQFRPAADLTNVNPELLNKAQTFANENEQLKQYRKYRNGYDQWNAAIKSGAPEVAVANFIAGKGGLDQGSFPIEFSARLKKLGLWDASAEVIRKKLFGGENPQLLESISKTLENQVKIAEARAVKAKSVLHTMVGKDVAEAMIGSPSSSEMANTAGFNKVE